MKNLINILTIVTAIFTISTITATVNLFCQNADEYSAVHSNYVEQQYGISDEPGTITASVNPGKEGIPKATFASVEEPGITTMPKNSFVFMGEIFPGEPEDLFSGYLPHNPNDSGFSFMGKHFDPMPAEEINMSSAFPTRL